MWFEYFGLREQPFGITPDPRFLYLGDSHREACASLLYGIEAERGFLGLIATPGMGKTTLLFRILEQLNTSARTIFVFNTQCNARELLDQIFADAGLETDGNFARAQRTFYELVVREARLGRRVLIVIDEAQNLDFEGLETVRLLTNFQTPRAPLVQVLLAGQPQLGAKLEMEQLAQLRQRMSILCELHPFGLQETADYIAHRLAVSGHDGTPLFTREALGLIAIMSDGIPRNINNICFNALTLAFAEQVHIVDEAITTSVLADPQFSPGRLATRTAEQRKAADAVIAQPPRTQSAAAATTTPVVDKAVVAPVPPTRVVDKTPAVAAAPSKTSAPVPHLVPATLAVPQTKHESPRRLVSPVAAAVAVPQRTGTDDMPLKMHVVQSAPAVSTRSQLNKVPAVSNASSRNVEGPAAASAKAKSAQRTSVTNTQPTGVRSHTGNAKFLSISPDQPARGAATRAGSASGRFLQWSLAVVFLCACLAGVVLATKYGIITSRLPLPPAPSALQAPPELTHTAETQSQTTEPPEPHTTVDVIAVAAPEKAVANTIPSTTSTTSQRLKKATTARYARRSKAAGRPVAARPQGVQQLMEISLDTRVVMSAESAASSANVEPGHLIRFVRPEVPLTSISEGDREVELMVSVGKDGRVRSIDAVRGNSKLVTRAKEAVRQWQYEPWKRDGNAVEAVVDVNLRFPPHR